MDENLEDLFAYKNSPKKPEVPGRPSPAKAKTTNKKEYLGK